MIISCYHLLPIYSILLTSQGLWAGRCTKCKRFLERFAAEPNSFGLLPSLRSVSAVKASLSLLMSKWMRERMRIICHASENAIPSHNNNNNNQNDTQGDDGKQPEAGKIKILRGKQKCESIRLFVRFSIVLCKKNPRNAIIWTMTKYNSDHRKNYLFLYIYQNRIRKR